MLIRVNLGKGFKNKKVREKHDFQANPDSVILLNDEELVPKPMLIHVNTLRKNPYIYIHIL